MICIPKGWFVVPLGVWTGGRDGGARGGHTAPLTAHNPAGKEEEVRFPRAICPRDSLPAGVPRRPDG